MKCQLSIERVAALYDIHGNLPALEAVLDEVRDARVDLIVVGGDVLPGPMPREALVRLLSLDVPVQFICGNGDLAVFAANGCGHATCRTVWTAHTTSSIGQQPAVTSGGIVYVASADGVLRAYPAAGCGHPTCASLWSAPTGSMITGGPVAALGNVYVGTSDGRLIAYGP